MTEIPIPQRGDVVRVRQRSYLVSDVGETSTGDSATRVHLSCLDDDAAGEPLTVLWQLEVDGEILPEATGLGQQVNRLDDPRTFGAYLNAIKWGCATATDPTLFQSPFRAGIDLKAYQLEPLRKALALPRVNLFIADDVGLGKTIEAGLVAQELILRQRVDRILIVCPPAVTLQWQEEMEQRFGLSFALYNSEFVTARRRERGWGINPWTTHSRFIVSYAMLRGSQGGGATTPHLELLLGALRTPGASRLVPRTLLILDECHNMAPAGGSLYAVDTRTTRAVRQVAERFEHRLFLSATPHNGHSQSFSALLEMLDPQRFTRGVPITGARALEPVMVRRLKRDLRGSSGGARFPIRRLVDHTISLESGDPEIQLGHLLAEYDGHYRAALAHLPPAQQRARALVLVTLHKRLLSSVAAFAKTLETHAKHATRTLEDAEAQPAAEPPSREGVDEGISDDELDAREDEWVGSASISPGEEGLRVLKEMLKIAQAHRHQPDGRVKRLAR